MCSTRRPASICCARVTSVDWPCRSPTTPTSSRSTTSSTGARVVFRTAEGTKLAAAVLGRGVAFEVDGYDPEAGEAWSVVVKGYAIEIERMHDYFDALDLPLFPWHAAPKHRFVRIEPSR